MEFSPRKRKRTSATNGNGHPHAAATSASRRNSSSSSDILVAAPTPSSSSRTGPSGMEDRSSTATMGVAAAAPPPPPPPARRKWITARVEGGRHLVVEFNGIAARTALEGMVNAWADEEKALEMQSLTTRLPSPSADNEGPNARGTFSKAYVVRHPEIEWVHRGQGRYLPATQARNIASAAMVERTPRTRESRQSSGRADLSRGDKMPDDSPRTLPESTRRRGLNRDASLREPASDSLSARPSLRSTKSFDDEPLRPLHVTRSGRNAKPDPEADSPERRSSRFSSRRTYNEQDSPGTDDDLDGDKDQTYDRDYVNEHPDEQFYHTGNGWYKRGQRPRGNKLPKKRDSAGQATARLSEGTFKFEAGQTIHSTQLALYPNIEFHHCGNGWYKPGPDATGHRNSTIIEASPSEIDTAEEAEADAEMAANLAETTVSREYANAHPEIEWVHRGNGRYRAKQTSVAAQTPDSPAEETQFESNGDTKTYSREYVDAHPNEVFHHRGNARYMRGPPPQRWADARKQRRQSINTEAAPAAPTPPEQDDKLYDRAWVDAHPHEVYHHRGQGRYARGPRKPRASLPQPAAPEVEEDSDGDPDELVDTKYVQEHPHQTFHHRGQGRWARGLPPIGANNKIAVRGPGAVDRPSGGTSLAGEEEEEDIGEEPPPLTALVARPDGPFKFPQFTWHYRGGGKWCRLTKQEVENMNRRQNGRMPKGRARRSLDGAGQQLEREAAAAEVAGYSDEDDEGYGFAGEDQDHLTAKPRQLSTRRRRTHNLNARDAYNTMDEDLLLSKQSSQKSVSQAPTPKPRIMTEEEDVLADEDLPQLYRDEWSPPTEDLDEADILLRRTFRPVNGPEVFLKGMTKHEPNTRPTKNLIALAENADVALQAIAAEYLELEKLTAPHRRVPGKPAKGGTVPIDPLTWEDKKEADLYDYHFDPRKIGEQDPDAQRIQRDAEGRELRGRRNRSAFTNTHTVPGWNFGEDQPLGPRRAVKAPQRFDGVVVPPRKRARNSTTATRGTSQAPSLTPERGLTPAAEAAALPATKGRWAGHVPKRVQELRGESVAASVGPGPGPGPVVVGGGRRSKEGSPARKGRPPGSKNLHKRKDAGIKKGPRKPKVVDVGAGGELEGVGMAGVEGLGFTGGVVEGRRESDREREVGVAGGAAREV